jgi:hypothetical protein
MKPPPHARALLGLGLLLVFAAPASAQNETIKIGILHSLTGTMAISESVLTDTVAMLIEDQNRKGGLLGRKLEPVVVDPASNWDLCRKGARPAYHRKGGGCVRLLDLRLAQSGIAGLRAFKRSPVLPGAE